MNITLIQPATSGVAGWYPPLGLGYLAVALGTHGHHVEIVDLNAVEKSDEQLKRMVNRADIIGITSNTMAVHEEALRLAHLFDGANIVFGGPQASALPEPYLKIPDAIVFNGESEISFPAFLHAIEHKKSGLNLPGLIFRDNTGNIVRNAPPPLIQDLDNHPLPARYLFDMDLYQTRLKGRRATNVMSSRGCPFHCIFCYHDFLGKVYRPRSPQNVVEELIFLQQKYDIQAILFYDDNFTLQQERVHAICDLIIEQKLDILWRCCSRVNGVNKDLLTKMKQAGCCEIVFGVESGSQRTLDLAQKGIRVEESIQAIELCHEIGITTKTCLMIGFPWETKYDIEQTLSLIDKIPFAEIHILIVMPFPGTPLEKMLKEQNIDINTDVDVTNFALPSFETANFTKEDLLHYRDIGHDKIQAARCL